MRAHPSVCVGCTCAHVSKCASACARVSLRASVCARAAVRARAAPADPEQGAADHGVDDVVRPHVLRAEAHPRPQHNRRRQPCMYGRQAGISIRGTAGGGV